MIEVRLPDGNTLELSEGSTAEDAAYKIGTGLGDDTVAAKVNGELVSKHETLEDGDELEIITEESEEYIKVLRHTASHVLAQAVKRLFPEAKLAIGPYTDDGFYYDIEGVEIEQEELEEIEEEALSIINDDISLERVEVSREEARERVKDNRFKQEILEEEASGETVTFYEQGEFEDLCEGPHVQSTGKIGGFKLTEIAGAYWRGNEENEMLTRIYGTAFPTEEELEAHLEKMKEAEKRDHRRIGQQMNLFSIPEFSPGAAHYHPQGMKIRRELEDYIREKNKELGYEEVWTPELNKAELWKKTGHYEAFKEEGEMFAWEQNEEEYGLKPMNCANHSHIFQSRKRSYKELPKKYSEFGTVYRNEQSGELSGLLRVRGLTQDDGHAYIREDQIREEIKKHLEIVREMYDEFGFKTKFILETKPEKAQGPDELWEKAETALEETLEEIGVEFEINPGEGAFYGPKIGVEAEDAIGRHWQLGTVQLDFVIPRNYGLKYVGEDNEEHYAVMIHRAILGSIERFMGILTEHFAGEYPLWLAPEQVRILPITDDNIEYAEDIQDQLKGVRTTIEDRSWTLDKKIQNAHDDNVPYMVIVGDNEEEEGTVSLRSRDEQEVRDVNPEELCQKLHDEIEQKRLETRVLEEFR